MQPEFLPFRPSTPQSPNPGFVSLRVLPASPSQPAFSPFAKPHAHPCTQPTPNSTPLISLHRDADRVTGIRIQCSCGQIIELACEF